MDRQEAARLLRWYVDIGVDEAVCDVAVDRFVTSPPPPRKAPSRTARTRPRERSGTDAPSGRTRTPPAAPESPHVSLERARDLANEASSLDELLNAIRAFDGCPLKRTATTTCICDGNPDSGIMVIGEAPGAEEDRKGKPFVGPAGWLLDRMLATIGLDRSSVYITNTLYWRPPGNRTPTPEEIAVCLPFLERQVELIRPKILVFAGGTAVKAMFSTSEGITRLRGRWFRRELPDGEAVPAIAMFHPAYLLRQPARKRESWHDLLTIRAKMEELAIAPPDGTG